MKNVTSHNANFQVVTPQKFEDKVTFIKANETLLGTDFYFIHGGDRFEVARYDAEKKELKEYISGIVSIQK